MSLLNATGRSRSASAGGATSTVRKVWELVWLVVVPLFVAVYVDMEVGDAWGSIPAFWLDGEPTLSVAATLVLLTVFALCLALHRLHADLVLGVMPIAVGLVAHLAFGGQWAWAGWAGLAGAVAVGLLVLRRRR